MEGHHIDLHDEPRRIAVDLDGVTIADSERTVTLQETGLPARHYFPRDDVRMELLEATLTETVCPFKGQASYWAIRVGDSEHRDLAWSYAQPIEGMERIAGLVCFYDERVDVTIDGRPEARPESPWSTSKTSS